MLKTNSKEPYAILITGFRTEKEILHWLNAYAGFGSNYMGEILDGRAPYADYSTQTVLETDNKSSLSIVELELNRFEDDVFEDIDDDEGFEY